MSNTHVDIQKISFDVSDPEITIVTIDIKHDDDGIFMKNRYEKSFPARISVIELLQKHINDFLLW